MSTVKELQRRDYQPVPDRENGAPAVAPIGYRDKDGVALRAVQGDEAFPFFKDPPDVTPVATVWRAAAAAEDTDANTPNVLPQAAAPADLELLSPVSTVGYRTLNLLIEFFPIAAAPSVEAQLYFMLSAGFDLPQNMYRLDAAGDTVTRVWAPVGVVDPTVRGADAAPFSLNPPCVAFRNTYASQFNMRGMTALAFDPLAPCAMTLVFDVTPYSVVRLGIGASNDTSTAGVLYTLGR